MRPSLKEKVSILSRTKQKLALQSKPTIALKTKAMRHRYDSFIKLAYCLGLEKRLLTKDIRHTIPRSTASTWRSLDVEQIMKVKFSKELRKKILDFIAQENQFKFREKELLKLSWKFSDFLFDAIGEKEVGKLFKENKAKLIKLIDDSSEIVDQKALLRLLRIKRNTFYQWKSEVRYFCTSSPIYLCCKDFPTQITGNEVEVMKRLLSNNDTKHWSIASIHGKAFRLKLLNIACSTLYKYNKIFEFRKKQKKGKKPKYKPLLASRPNEIWHADISVFTTEDGKRHYIYAIIDNYSRKILEWDISGSSNGRMSKKLLRKALRKCKIGDLQYITDAGVENVNWTIKEYLNEHHASIAHSIALKDIRQSNSMIESVFRIMKSGYLYLHKIKNRKSLFKIMKAFVYEYNELRPHHTQKYYTPSEIYCNYTNSVDVKRLYRDAAKNRFKENKNCSCIVCENETVLE